MEIKQIAYRTLWVYLHGAMSTLPAGMFKTLVMNTIVVLALTTSIRPANAADDIDALQQKAVQDAVERVAPSVVRIETIGGLEQVDNVQFGSGPMSGLIVGVDGYIVSSAFGLSNKPSSIIVRLPDGTRKPAKLAAVDHVRQIALLKIETDQKLPVCETANTEEMRVGQWAIALGRTFDADKPNVSVGILSAKDRVWGKAIQTDASVSPNNYGGPLVDIYGRVMGVLVPLSPDSADDVAGYEWYDSGIGFAIPADHIQKILPRMKKGEDLHQGIAGIGMKSQNIYTSEPVIAVCRIKSPAAEAGLKPGDKIIEVEGRKINRSAEFREEINRRYAGDKIRLVVLRDDNRVDRELTLAEKIPPYLRPFMGVLPMRDVGKDGVKIRYVYPDSPAAKIGLAKDDVIVSINAKSVETRDDLIKTMIDFEPNQSVDLEILHKDIKEHKKLILGAMSQSLPPAALPPSIEKRTFDETKGLETGTIKLKVPEFPNEAIAYVPENYNSNVHYGLVVWLHGKEGLDWDKTLALWKPLCRRYDMILLAPRAADADAKKWTPAEVDVVNRLIGQVIDKYSVDPLRVVVHGYENGGTMAAYLSIRNRDNVRAIAVVDTSIAIMPPENEPQYRFDMYIVVSGKSPAARSSAKALAKLQEMNIPLVEKTIDGEPRYLNAEELDELARWIDMLDRI